MEPFWNASLGHFQNSIKYYDEVQWTWLTALVWVVLGYTCSMLGDPETGRKHAEKGIEIQRESGVEMHLAFANYYVGLIHLELHDLKNARRLYAGGVEVIRNKQ
ncbi:MAG: tetratricopeptide repeat protein [Chloroflexi bacterium]|nr:tetratricopeptide repeat protein [Chloroflexota bacterium]